MSKLLTSAFSYLLLLALESNLTLHRFLASTKFRTLISTKYHGKRKKYNKQFTSLQITRTLPFYKLQ